MRILFIAPFGTCHKQTVLRRMLPLAQGLAARGHQVEALIPAWDCPAEAGRVMVQAGVTVRWPKRGPTLHPLSDLFLLWRAQRAARAFRPQLVHAFKTFGYSGALTQWFQRQGGVVTVVDVDDLETVAGWGRGRPLLMRLAGGAQEAQTVRRAQGVTAVSLGLRVQAGYLRHFGQDEVLYLPNGLDRAATPAPVAANPPIVLLYTRGNDVDPARLSAVWQRVLAAAPDARLRIVGDWAGAPPLPATDYLGWLDAEALLAALRGSALALFPAPDTPALRAKSPARLLDCLAQGLPVITTEVGEYGLLAGNGGRVVETDDDRALADATVAALLSPALRAEMGAATWEAARRHTWAVRIETLCTWYRRLGVEV